MKNLLLLQLNDLVSAEDQLIESLPRMAHAASSPDLKSAFTSHLEETKLQRRRLSQIFKILQAQSGSELCDAMRGLVAEAAEIIGLPGDPQVKDAALIAAAQRVEHYEMAAYGSARAFALQLECKEVADLLQETLDEEGNADKILTQLAESHINADAPVM